MSVTHVKIERTLNGQYTIPHMIDQFGHVWRQDLHALGILFINRKVQDTPAIFAAQLAEFFSVIFTESNQIDMALKRTDGQIQKNELNKPGERLSRDYIRHLIEHSLLLVLLRAEKWWLSKRNAWWVLCGVVTLEGTSTSELTFAF